MIYPRSSPEAYQPNGENFALGCGNRVVLPFVSRQFTPWCELEMNYYGMKIQPLS